MKIIRMDSTMLDSFVNSSYRPLLPTNGDSINEINETQFELKEEENDENEDDSQQAYDELYTLSLELVKKNKKLREESKRLNQDLISSNDELREKEETINCLDSKFMISLHNLSKVQDELNELKIGYDELNKENLSLREKLKRQDEDIINLESKLTISKEIVELGSSDVIKLKSELKLAYEDLNNIKGIGNELIKVQNENATLKTQVTQLESHKRKCKYKFTQGEEKYEKLFR
eukprot:TRINITY_DN22936_c0_g1_i1.p1 TRINITY_DN22936_c0_g1~~TRINITY_DN22936_c0_g1_i1.p1  ORF type:complete len:233 (+),score=36.87 TRINITY_DN22936_c0_g1_i1:216-914(+)